MHSESTIVVLSGSFSFEQTSDGTVNLDVGDIAITGAGVPHKLVSLSNGRAITLHIYTPPLRDAMPSPYLDLASAPVPITSSESAI
jgi:quercetin dioxygenase-like cupin family protein